MELKHYLEQAANTETNDYSAVVARMSLLPRLTHALDGLVTEVGELVDVKKKHEQYSKPIDWVNLGEELGDVMWYVAVLASVIEENTGVTLEGWLDKNIAKLKARYPDKFTEHNAINRDLEKERAILEDDCGEHLRGCQGDV